MDEQLHARPKGHRERRRTGRRGQRGHHRPPQGSPVFPTLFTIYIAEIYTAVKRRVEMNRGISFAGDATWVVEGENTDEAVQRLERCAAASLEWAGNNAVRFELSKAEAMPSSRRVRHWRAGQRRLSGSASNGSLRQRGHAMVEPMAWLGPRPPGGPTALHRQARQAEAKVQRLTTKYGVPPASARNLQMAIIQSALLYAAELTWSGQKGVESEYQAAINRMGRAALGALRSTPLGVVAAESKITPAGPLLEHRQARFAQRLLARPQAGKGPEEILSRKPELTGRLIKTTKLHTGDEVEQQN